MHLPDVVRPGNCANKLYVCVYACMYACMPVCLYVCIYVCIYMSAEALPSNLLTIFVTMHLCIYTCMHFCMCTFYAPVNWSATRQLACGQSDTHWSHARSGVTCGLCHLCTHAWRMYVCMYVCMYMVAAATPIDPTLAAASLAASATYAHMRLRVYVCTYLCMYVCSQTRNSNLAAAKCATFAIRSKPLHVYAHMYIQTYLREW